MIYYSRQLLKGDLKNKVFTISPKVSLEEGAQKSESHLENLQEESVKLPTLRWTSFYYCLSMSLKSRCTYHTLDNALHPDIGDGDIYTWTSWEYAFGTSFKGRDMYREMRLQLSVVS